MTPVRGRSILYLSVLRSHWSGYGSEAPPELGQTLVRFSFVAMLILGVLLVVLVHVSPKKSPQIGEHLSRSTAELRQGFDPPCPPREIWAMRSLGG